MANVNVANPAAKPNGTTGVSLVVMQEQMAALMADNAALKAAMAPAAQSGAPGSFLLPKKAAEPVKPGPMAKIVNGKLVPVDNGSGNGRRKSKSICGAKSPNGLCQKCEGPFDPIKHFSLGALHAMDGIATEPTSNDWDERAFLGISVDAKYQGNVVLIGFGRDAINMRPKTFLRLANAISVSKAAAHVTAVLPESFYKSE